MQSENITDISIFEIVFSETIQGMGKIVWLETVYIKHQVPIGLHKGFIRIS
jgi:hypothetical protein